MRKLLPGSGGLRGLLAGVVTALLAGQLALAVLPAPGHDCGHGSCPKRPPVKAASKPPCHGSHGEEAAAPAGASCSLSSSCQCGHSHSPAAPHHEVRAVLAMASAGRLPSPAGLVAPLAAPSPLGLASVPESPPPRS